MWLVKLIVFGRELSGKLNNLLVRRRLCQKKCDQNPMLKLLQLQGFMSLRVRWLRMGL